MTATKASTHHHRSTLSQSNKPFKARHATKGSLKQLAKGRTEKKTAQDQKKSRFVQTLAGQKASRKNQAKQLQAEKAKQKLQALEIFSGPDPAPRIIAVLALSDDVNPLTDVLTHFRRAAGLENSVEPSSVPESFIWPSSRNGLLQFILIPHGTPLGKVLSTVCASDFLVASLSALEECSPWGETTLRAIQSMGGPLLGTVGIVCHLESLSGGSKESLKTRESLTSFLRYFFPETLLLNHIISVEASQEISAAVRSMLTKVPLTSSGGRKPSWREGRARLVGLQVTWEGEHLKVSGHVRGGRFSADRLVHVPFWGDYKVAKITMGNEEKVACSRTEEADDLVSENSRSIGDELMAEQTWPTEEEISSAPANKKGAGKLKKSRRVPFGTSEYQAAWIVDLDGEEELEEEEEEEMRNECENIDEENQNEELLDDEKEMEDLQTESQHAGSSKEVHFTDLTEEVEMEELAQYRALRQRERDMAREDEEFPDEIDTPMGVAASQRFARYRGMKSFRTSEWDPYENLPAEYGKVFHFEGWRAMGRKLEQKANEVESGAGPGMKVTLYLEGFLRTEFELLSLSLPLIVFSLFKHEHKYTVMHFTTQRDTEFEGEIKSKEKLIACVGFRFFEIQPIWSQPSVKSRNNVHKFERYLRHGKMNIGTVYMPVTFGGSTPVIILKEQLDGRLDFVGSGTLVGSEPQKIIAKRIVLTGHPYKVHKKTATIRYMFFNREDIEYFKPIELKTKKGRAGHIKEPLGTHGYFKAKFDGPIDQMDTICMSLYKRCFPRWASGWKGTQDSEKSGIMELDAD
ncbi:hypothetical protein BY996DRAFT_6410749 [Phakopsora pachyrhizi]|nr:hypothetical protein BY996DRAFT_6410749 [Phakopsora pachyrhizi]